jgi:hypothetical protein
MTNVVHRRLTTVRRANARIWDSFMMKTKLDMCGERSGRSDGLRPDSSRSSSLHMIGRSASKLRRLSVRGVGERNNN